MTAIQNPYVQQNPSASDISYAVGESVISRLYGGTSLTLLTQRIAFALFTAQRTETVANITTLTTGTAAAGLTYAAAGLYSVDGSGNLTKLADTGDLHTTLWIASFTEYSPALTAAVTKTAGQRYAVAVLAVGTTPPSLASTSNASGSLLPIQHAPSLELGSQATLPASVLVGSLAAGTNYFSLVQAYLSPAAPVTGA